MQNGKEVSYKDFMSKMVARFAPWTEAKVKEILRESFSVYETSRQDQYVQVLTKAREREVNTAKLQANEEAQRIRREEAERFAASPEEVERRRLLTEEQYGPEFCPTCGEKTVMSIGWWSGTYHMPGWKCDGSIAHFLKWARENRRR